MKPSANNGTGLTWGDAGFSRRDCKFCSTGARDDATPTNSSAAGSTAGSAAAGRPSDGAGAAARYYPAAGVVLRRLPGAVSGRRRRRAAVLQGARLRRVRERGRGDRHVPVLRRGPVTVTAAAAAEGGLLQRRGDRARAVAEVGVGNNSKLKTGPAGGGAYLCESFSSP